MVGGLQPITEFPGNGLATWPCLLDVLVHKQAKKNNKTILLQSPGLVFYGIIRVIVIRHYSLKVVNRDW